MLLIFAFNFFIVFFSCARAFVLNYGEPFSWMLSIQRKKNALPMKLYRKCEDVKWRARCKVSNEICDSVCTRRNMLYERNINESLFEFIFPSVVPTWLFISKSLPWRSLSIFGANECALAQALAIFFPFAHCSHCSSIFAMCFPLVLTNKFNIVYSDYCQDLKHAHMLNAKQKPRHLKFQNN